jgi:hypothetical protein
MSFGKLFSLPVALLRRAKFYPLLTTWPTNILLRQNFILLISIPTLFANP